MENWKWGKIDGTGNKWYSGNTTAEKGRLYEGEKYRNNYNFARFLKSHLYKTLISKNYNKAKFNEIIRKSQGFCVNQSSWWSSYGWRCEYTQAHFSNVWFSGYATPYTDKKSKGNPSFKSDATQESSQMTNGPIGQPGLGNALQTTNYYTSFKWASDVTAKWDNISRPDTAEKSRNYEGEGAVSKPYLSICSKRLSALIFTYYINKIREKQNRKTFKTFNFWGFETPSEFFSGNCISLVNEVPYILSILTGNKFNAFRNK